MKKIEIVNTTDPIETEGNRIKLQAFKYRIAEFFHPISKHFSNNIKFVSDEISEMPEMKNLPKGDLKDFTSKIGYAISLGFKEKEIFLFGLMQNEYRSGIASSIALSQIQYAASGFSIGVGHGEFKNKDEMAVGIGYGGQFNEDVGFQFQFGSSGDSTGFGFTVNF